MSYANGYPLVSILILNYNGGQYIVDCLSSVLSTDYSNFEVILIDNASTDGSLDAVSKLFGSDPRLRIVNNKKNLGFAEGNNVGAGQARGKYFIFLNFDTLVDPKWLKELLKVFREDPKVGIAQCSIHLMDNPKMFDNVGHYIDSVGITYFIGFHEEDRGQYSHPHEMFGACGAAFAVRADVFKKLKGFDSDFFLFFEESDLCWRTWIAGYKVVYAPNAIVYHKGGVSYKGKKGYSSTTMYFYVRNRLMALLKNYELKNLLKFVPINIIFMIGLFLINVRYRKTNEAKAIISGILWNLYNLKKIVRKRKITQLIRKVSDDFLLQKGIIRRFNMQKAINKARDMNLI
jgi:GT2 family glycosyltransferase